MPTRSRKQGDLGGSFWERPETTVAAAHSARPRAMRRGRFQRSATVPNSMPATEYSATKA